MALHKLTVDKAQVIDYALKFLSESTHSVLTQEAYGELLLTGYFNEIEIPYHQAYHHFYITDTLIIGEPSPPYKRTQEGLIEKTKYTQSFLDNGGFVKMAEELRTEEKYTDQLRRSTLNTNRWMTVLTLLLTLFAGVTLFLEYSKKDPQEHKKIQEEKMQPKQILHNSDSGQSVPFQKDSLNHP